MQVVPLENRLIVRPEKEEYDGLIVIPETVRQDDGIPKIGTVVAVGPGRWEKGHRVPMQVQVGDKIIYKGRAYGLTVDFDGEPCFLMWSAELGW